MKYVVATYIIFLSMTAAAANEKCDAWFSQSSINPASLDCEIQCSVLPVDLGTFICHDQCSELCRYREPCQPNAQELVNKSLENIRPLHWPNAQDKIKKWTPQETATLKEAFQSVPRDIWPNRPLEFLRFDSSIHNPNPASSLVSAGDVAFYDTAFSGPIPLSRVLIHEFAHFYYQSLGDAGQSDYKIATRWWASDPRPGEFVEDDGRDSPEEDFANNLEYMAMDPARLMAVTPNAYTWLKNKFGDKLSKGDTCDKK